MASLTACLETYRANCRRHARDVEFVVMDDVAQDEIGGEETASGVRAALRAFQATGDETIRYAGPSEKRRFAEALARESSVPRGLIDFALFGDHRCHVLTGANRNGLLLDTVGAAVFGADDDTRTHIAQARELQNPPLFSSEYEPREFWFFPDRRRALEGVRPADADLLADHEAFLGRPLAEIGGSPGLNGEIVITLPGLVGDSGMGSPHHLLTLNGASRERLVASEATYLSALRSREVLRTVHQPTIAATAFCMTTFFGFDNRRLLPPFFPVARNSDGLFGLMVQRAIAGSHVAFLPSALVHEPPEPRTFAGNEAWTEPARIRMADVLLACILVQQAGAVSATSGVQLRLVGKYLRELASLSSDDFEAFVRSAQQMRNETFIALLETRFGQHRAAPAFWANDVRKSIEYLRRAATGSSYIAPRDLGPVDSARALARELVGKFGELVEAWPTLVEAAHRLQTVGCRVSVRVQ